MTHSLIALLLLGLASPAAEPAPRTDAAALFAPPDKAPKQAPKGDAKPAPQPKPKPRAKPKPAAPAKKPGKVPSCKLLTTEAPRGGRLEIEGEHLGKTPLVRIAGKVTRIIERHGNVIAVQIHRDSNGGEITVKVSKQDYSCGTLTITGTD